MSNNGIGNIFISEQRTQKKPNTNKKRSMPNDDVVARSPDGYIIAKGNIIEGIEAKE